MMTRQTNNLSATESSYDDFADIYDEFRGTDEKLYDVNIKKLWIMVWMLLLGYKTDMGMFLDLGCGTGAYSLYMTEAGHHGVGVDLSGRMLEIAKNKAREKRLALEFIKQDATELSLPYKFKCIFSNEAIPHFENLDTVSKVFLRCWEHLEPKGYLLFQFCTSPWLKKMAKGGQDDFTNFSWHYSGTYNESQQQAHLEYAFNFKDGRKLTIPFNFKGYTPDEIKNELKKIGFCDIRFFNAEPKTYLNNNTVDKVDFLPLESTTNSVMCVAAKPDA